MGKNKDQTQQNEQHNQPKHCDYPQPSNGRGLNGALNRTEGGRRDTTARAPSRRVERATGVEVGSPAHHNEANHNKATGHHNKATGPIAEQNVALNMRVHYRTRHTKTHVPVGGRMELIPGSRHLGLPRHHHRPAPVRLGSRL